MRGPCGGPVTPKVSCMSRYAVLIDAGYLFAAASALISGGKSLQRHKLKIDNAGLIARLKKLGENCCGPSGASLLRIYWYDGARGSVTPEQTRIAELDDVKLRLGQINGMGQQKGVDSLIVTDLFELARNHAITDAIIVSGDEDLRVGLVLSQSFGVRVHLVGIAPSRSNQSPTLRQESDTVRELTKDDFRDIIEPLSGPDNGPETQPDPALPAEKTDFDAFELPGALQTALKLLTDALSPEERVAIKQGNQAIPKQIDGQLIGMMKRHLLVQVIPNQSLEAGRTYFRRAVV